MINNNRGVIGLAVFIIIAVIVVGVGIYFLSTSSTSYGDERGRVVFAITDAAVNMGSVSEVRVTIDSIEAHSTTGEWATVTSNTQEYDLLELKANNEIRVMADENVAAGNYDQFRLVISRVVVVDANGSHEAKLPSGELKIFTNMTVDDNSTASATFDFIADESLHITGNGRYIMAPVIQLEIRDDANIESEGEGRIRISDGRVISNTKVGMDIDGNVGVGLRIPASSNLNIDSNGLVKIGSGSVAAGIGGSSSNNATAGGSSGGLGAGISGDGGVSVGGSSGGY